CYRRTYREHRSTPYLDRKFFGMLAERMPGNVLLVIAEREGKPVAAALDLFGGGVLYGRYWARPSSFPACISRRATTRAWSSASSAASRSSKAARRASTST